MSYAIPHPDVPLKIVKSDTVIVFVQFPHFNDRTSIVLSRFVVPSESFLWFIIYGYTWFDLRFLSTCSVVVGI